MRKNTCIRVQPWAKFYDVAPQNFYLSFGVRVKTPLEALITASQAFVFNQIWADEAEPIVCERLCKPGSHILSVIRESSLGNTRGYHSRSLLRRRARRCEAWRRTRRRRKWWWTSRRGAGRPHLIRKKKGKNMNTTCKRCKKLGCRCMGSSYPLGPADVSLPGLSLQHRRPVPGSPGWTDGALCPCRWVLGWGAQNTLSSQTCSGERKVRFIPWALNGNDWFIKLVTFSWSNLNAMPSAQVLLMLLLPSTEKKTEMYVLVHFTKHRAGCVFLLPKWTLWKKLVCHWTNLPEHKPFCPLAVWTLHSYFSHVTCLAWNLIILSTLTKQLIISLY